MSPPPCKEDLNKKKNRKKKGWGGGKKGKGIWRGALSGFIIFSFMKMLATTPGLCQTHLTRFTQGIFWGTLLSHHGAQKDSGFFIPSLNIHFKLCCNPFLYKTTGLQKIFMCFAFISIIPTSFKCFLLYDYFANQYR